MPSRYQFVSSQTTWHTLCDYAIRSRIQKPCQQGWWPRLTPIWSFTLWLPTRGRNLHSRATEWSFQLAWSSRVICTYYPVGFHEINRMFSAILHDDRGLSDFMQVDTAFSGSLRLSVLPQLIYGLLKSPIFAKSPGSNPDMMAVTKYAWSSLPPNLLATAIYPCLIACSGPDDMVSPEKRCKTI